MKKDTWVVIANSSIARIFKVAAIHSFEEIETLCHPESRLKSSELVTDKPGRGFESGTNARHAVEPHHSPKENEFDRFAEEVASTLEKFYKNNEFKSLYVAASPHFLGLLKSHLKDGVAQSVEEYISKDLTALKQHEINESFINYVGK